MFWNTSPRIEKQCASVGAFYGRVGGRSCEVSITSSLDVTAEDKAVMDSNERAGLYGQWDHVRAYGSDYPDRLREAGFNITILMQGIF